MAAITVRNLSDETHRALKVRARSHGRSTEAEVRDLLDRAVSRGEEPGLGTILHESAMSVGGADLDDVRDRSPHEPIDLG